VVKTAFEDITQVKFGGKKHKNIMIF